MNNLHNYLALPDNSGQSPSAPPGAERNFVNPMDGFVKVGGEVTLAVSPQALWILTQEFLTTANEIAGLFLVQSGEITWVGKCPGRGTGGSIISDATEYIRATQECLEATSEIPNGQWHTHPQMNCFWSLTDLDDHKRSIDKALAFSPEQGEMWFLVIDIPDMLIRRYFWENGSKVQYRDGVCMIGTSRTEVPRGFIWANRESPKKDIKPKTLGGFKVGDGVSFEFQSETYHGEVTDFVEEGDRKGNLLVYAYKDGKAYYVPPSLAKFEADLNPSALPFGFTQEALRMGGPATLLTSPFQDDRAEAWDETLGDDYFIEVREGARYLFRDCKTGNDLEGIATCINDQFKTCDMLDNGGILIESTVFFEDIIQEVRESNLPPPAYSRDDFKKGQRIGFLDKNNKEIYATIHGVYTLQLDVDDDYGHNYVIAQNKVTKIWEAE